MMEGRLLVLCSAEKEKFSISELKTLLSVGNDLNVDALDEHGMTPLMHCAYRGHSEGCRLLLHRGAMVNNNLQKDGYTALMFAAVAGQLEVVKMLLRGGANPSAANNLRKTASNMAAFVGQHRCAQIILSYFSIHELDRFTTPSQHSDKPRLSPFLAPPLHAMLVSTQLHPVLVLQELEKCPDIVKQCSDVVSVLSALGLRLLNEQKEGLALKLHYLSHFIQLAHDHGVDEVIRRVLTFEEAAGKPLELDLLLRQCLREFPHPNIPLLKQTIASLAKTPPGDSPSAYTLIVALILGDKGAAATCDVVCFTCGKDGPLKKCSRCKRVWYCTVGCQHLAWTKGNHKKLCKRWTARMTTPTTPTTTPPTPTAAPITPPTTQ